MGLCLIKYASGQYNKRSELANIVQTGSKKKITVSLKYQKGIKNSSPHGTVNSHVKFSAGGTHAGLPETPQSKVENRVNQSWTEDNGPPCNYRALTDCMKEKISTLCYLRRAERCKDTEATTTGPSPALEA